MVGCERGDGTLRGRYGVWAIVAGNRVLPSTEDSSGVLGLMPRVGKLVTGFLYDGTVLGGLPGRLGSPSSSSSSEPDLETESARP